MYICIFKYLYWTEIASRMSSQFVLSLINILGTLFVLLTRCKALVTVSPSTFYYIFSIQIQIVRWQHLKRLSYRYIWIHCLYVNINLKLLLLCKYNTNFFFRLKQREMSDKKTLCFVPKLKSKVFINVANEIILFYG